MKSQFKILSSTLFGILGIFVSIISIFLSIFLYNQVESFSFFTHYISDLGDGPNHSNIIFNLGAIITGILFVNYFIFSWIIAIKFTHKNQRMNFILVLGFITSLGYILVGIFTKEKARLLHNIGSVFYFIGLSALSFYAGFWEFQKDNPNRVYGLVSLLIPLFPALYGIFFLAKSIVPQFESVTIFIEWIGYFAFKGWFSLFIGYFYFRKK
ncbi:MAG: DUF998 domain-containing protein [Candidatus Lokiarchaeota archaeon]|nr:DUF998 domain-containing protein [Candidatus Lokiarchaeota archaeon]MBD3339804.1 DUF998 domain-containing protein [Candidatus Lokiarchaeota archaeon]